MAMNVTANWTGVTRCQIRLSIGGAVGLTGHRGVNRDKVRFLLQHIRSLLQDVQGMLLGDTPLPIKVILEEVDIGLGWVLL